MVDGATAHDPPRSTRYLSPKNGSLYGRYSIGRNPGHGRKDDDVHSQTSPIICSAPYDDAPAGYAPTGAGRSAPPPRFAYAVVGAASPHGHRRRRPAAGSQAQAFSHSISVGSRPPAHAA